MTRSLPLLFLVGMGAEIASIIWVGGMIGTVPTLLLMLLGGVAGLKLIKSAGMSAAAALRTPVNSPALLQGLGAQAAAQSVSGLLFLLPGFFSDIIGLLLLLAPVRRWLGSRFQVDTNAGRPADDRRFERVIEAEAIEISGKIEPPDRPLH